MTKEMRDNVRQCIKQVKTRRGGKRRMGDKNVKTQRISNLKIFSTNGAGVKFGKMNSLNAEVRNTQANIVTLQETHFTQKGKLKMDPEFEIFEAIRNKKGGGTVIAAHKDLNPKLVEEHSEEFELLVVEVKTEETPIRIISGYGPQENWDEEKRIHFFLTLEIEIEKAELAGKAIIIEMDANAKLGSKYIAGDPHDMSPNGALLAAIIERHNLSVANGSEKCRGVITRRRNTRKRIEQSAIDFVLFSSDLKKHFISLHIDEERKHVLTRIKKTKKGATVKESDHNVLVSEFKCNISTTKKTETKIEAFNLKNKECQAKFKEYTTKTKTLSTTVDASDDVNTITERLVKKVNGCIAKNFSKIRFVTQKNDENDDDLYTKMRELKNKEDENSKKELVEVIEAIAQKAETNFVTIKTELKKIKPDEGAINAKELWRVKKKLCPKSRDPHSAMLDDKGNLLTSDEAIQKRALEVYTKRLEANKIEPHLEEFEKDTNTLCEIRLTLTKSNKTNPWTMEDLKYALKKYRRRNQETQ